MSARNPVVSVIIPTLNRLAYLRTALESLECQTYRDFEVIVLDDGSTDGTVGFLAGLEPSFAYRTCIHEGRERAFLRNAGVAMASGSLIAFLDDDDVWSPLKLERQVEFMHKSGAGMSYCFTTAIDATGEPDPGTTSLHKRLYRRHLRAGHSFESLAGSCLIFTSSVMVRREVFEAVGGFEEEYVGGEDWDFYLKVAKVASIAAIPEELVMYRLHHGNSAAGDLERRAKVGDARMRAAIAQLETAGSARERSLLLRAIAQNHYWADRNRESLRYSLASLRESPVAFASASNIMMLAKSALKSVR